MKVGISPACMNLGNAVKNTYQIAQDGARITSSFMSRHRVPFSMTILTALGLYGLIGLKLDTEV